MIFVILSVDGYERATGVSFENRQDLLGHKSSRITDHYCRAKIEELKATVENLSRVSKFQA